MKVTMIKHTTEADDLLIFSKKTRHLTSIDAYEDVKKMSQEEKEAELDYVFNTIGSSWEFVDYTFLIEDVTRAFTHQLVRHRVGVAFAQQAMRVAKMEQFGYLLPPKLNEQNTQVYDLTMDNIQNGYDLLLGEGVDAQDARGVLPTNIHTNILFKVNLRALADLSHVRLCIRAQGEFQNVAFAMMKEVIKVHPFAERIIGPECLINGRCKFPRYEQCPIKISHPHLQVIAPEITESVRAQWVSLTGHDPQPDVKKSWTPEDGTKE